MPSKITVSQASAGYNQGLRTGLGLSLLSGLPLNAKGVKDDNPHARPGLGRAMLNLLALLAKASQGSFTGIVGQEDVSFTPGEVLSNDVTLSLSALRFSEAPLSWVLETYVPALNNQSEAASLLLSGGGTHVFGGPSTEEVEQLIIPLWRQMGLDIKYTEIVPGFHPNASGEVEITLQPSPLLKPLDLTTAFRPQKVGASAVIAGLPVYLAEQTLDAASQRFARHGFNSPEFSLRTPLAGHGQAIMVWADNGLWRIGFSVVGRKGARLDTMVIQAVEDLFEFCASGAAIPTRQAIWCLLPMSQAGGASRILVNKPTQALRAALALLEKIRPGCVKMQPKANGTLLQISGRPWSNNTKI